MASTDTSGECAVFERAAQVFALLSDGTRLRLLAALCMRELADGELAAAVDLPDATVSQELGHLCRGGLVSSRREAAGLTYSVNVRNREIVCSAVRMFLHRH